MFGQSILTVILRDNEEKNNLFHETVIGRREEKWEGRRVKLLKERKYKGRRILFPSCFWYDRNNEKLILLLPFG